MAGQISSARERETRLLDAAAQRFVRFGFDKTTVAEVASEAGVSKGAVYLHFTSKDALLEALVLREMQAYAQAWARAVEAAPDGGAIGGMWRCALRALDANAVMSAILRRDPHVFGNYLRKPGNMLAAQRSGASRRAFVEAMQAAGAIRGDLDSAVAAHVMDMLSYGLVSMSQIKDPRDIPPTDALLDGIADFIERAFAPPDPIDGDAGKAIIRRMVDAGTARLAKAREGQA